MRTNDEIIGGHRVIIEQTGHDGGSGWIPGLDMRRPNSQARVIWSNGGGWDHVSVSWPHRCPTWDEMCAVKRIFFDDAEACIQYHPAKSDYVNLHPYCLHIWRPQSGILPVPYTWMIGPRDGESMSDVYRQADEALK